MARNRTGSKIYPGIQIFFNMFPISSSSKPSSESSQNKEIINKWFTEPIGDANYQSLGIKKLLWSGKTNFQQMEIMDLASFGRCLVLDGHLQSSQLDEFIYHESLVHPALLSHPNPKTVFIGGGGEGATAREVLSHKSVSRCVMVDIDGKCVEQSKVHLKDWHQGSFDDKRLDLVIDDAKKYIETFDGTFDVIIMDLADPIEGGPCALLYTVEFYKSLIAKLSPDGVFVTQSGPTALNTCNDVFTPLVRTVNKAFGNVTPFMSFVPSFLDNWGFSLARADPKLGTIFDKSEKEIDGLIETRISKQLRFFDGLTAKRIVSLPKWLRKEISSSSEIIHLNNPRFLYGL